MFLFSEKKRAVSHPGIVLGLVLALLVCLAGLSGCAVLNGMAAEGASPSVSVTETKQTRVATSTVQAGVCIDPSLSSDASFSALELSRLTQATAGWSHETPAGTEGAPPRPGLGLMVRQVLTDSYSSSAGSLMLQIPAPGFRSCVVAR